MNAPLPLRTLPRTDLAVTPICLGTMTFGEQVGQAEAHAILDHALERGVNFIDTAEMYSVPAKRETFGATESILGNWFAARPGARGKVVLATKVAGPARGMDWISKGSANLSAADIVGACDDSLKRLRTEVIDLYQIHWPARNVANLGAIYFDPSRDREVSSIRTQLEALATGNALFVFLASRVGDAGFMLGIGLAVGVLAGAHRFLEAAFDIQRPKDQLRLRPCRAGDQGARLARRHPADRVPLGPARRAAGRAADRTR